MGSLAPVLRAVWMRFALRYPRTVIGQAAEQ